MMKQLVAIFMITYNHEKYISQAIESVLMQKINLPYKLFIGEDLSSDNTREIVRKYELENPDKIKVYYNDKNLGGHNNGLQIYRACIDSGAKYIALLEGDDYWTDPYKLQKQVDFLEMNSQYSGCAHQCNVIYENNISKPHEYKKCIKNDFYFEEFLGKRLFHTASFVFRTAIIKINKIPDNLTSGDRALFLLCSTFGPIHFLDENMAIYRKSSYGISSWITTELLKKDFNIIPWMKSINPNFPIRKYKSFLYYTLVFYPPKHRLNELASSIFLMLFYSFNAGLKETLKLCYLVFRRMLSLYKTLRIS